MNMTFESVFYFFLALKKLKTKRKWNSMMFFSNSFACLLLFYAIHVLFSSQMISRRFFAASTSTIFQNTYHSFVLCRNIFDYGMFPIGCHSIVNNCEQFNFKRGFLPLFISSFFLSHFAKNVSKWTRVKQEKIDTSPAHKSTSNKNNERFKFRRWWQSFIMHTSPTLAQYFSFYASWFSIVQK